MENVLQIVENCIENKATIDGVWLSFKDGLLQAVHDFVPTKQVKQKRPHEPIWFNKKPVTNKDSFIPSAKLCIISESLQGPEKPNKETT